MFIFIMSCLLLVLNSYASEYAIIQPRPFNEKRDLDSLAQVAFANKKNILVYDESLEGIRELYSDQGLASYNEECAVIHQAKKVIGFITYDNEALISTLAVDQNYRNKRYGSILLEYALNELKKKNLPNAFVDTVSPAALIFYKKRGFIEVAPRKSKIPHSLTYFDLQNYPDNIPFSAMKFK